MATTYQTIAVTAGGPLIAVLSGTAIFWWFSPIEAGESEEQAAAWMEKNKTAGEIISEKKKDNRK